MDITLNDLLNFDKNNMDNIKIRFNQSNPEVNPMDLYLKDPERVNTQWFLWRSSQRYFKEGQIAVCLLKVGDDKWLLTTIKKIKKDLNVVNGINYEAEELSEYKKYYGRVIIKFHKTFQSQGIYYKGIYEELIVNQILPATFDGYDFPGYDKVKLTFGELENIISIYKKDWVAALENQKAVYLITDMSNGKLYVGSATGDNGMLLQRWRDYISNGHGGNKGLKMLVEDKGFDYVKQNFQYSILENYNAKVDDREILERESWWKEMLKTREFGYNCN
ncbi:MAG: GIY-YIG nuclease family protein [Clostridiaceae bacterium]|nr:GIY-YIG nuclease family protein [Clostridiaceae bacterium]